MTVTTPSQALSFGLALISSQEPQELRYSLLGGFVAVF